MPSLWILAHQNKAARNSACLPAITQFKHKKWKRWGLGPLFFKISESSLGPRAFLEPMPYQVHGGTGSGFRSWISHCGVEHLHFNNPWSSFFWTQQWIKCPEFEFGTPHSHWVNFFLLFFWLFPLPRILRMLSVFATRRSLLRKLRKRDRVWRENGKKCLGQRLVTW